MTDEDAVLHKLLERPNNDLTRLVYADWLDERQTPDSVAKAEFLRLIADPELIGKFPERAAELAGQLDPQWLAVVGKLPIENCDESKEPEVRINGYGVQFVFECPKAWEELTPVGERRDVRHCEACQKTVHYCHDTDDLRRHANFGNCVAVELGVPRRPGDLEPERFAMTMGMIAFDPDSPGGEEWPAADPPRGSWWGRLLRRERRRNGG